MRFADFPLDYSRALKKIRGWEHSIQDAEDRIGDAYCKLLSKNEKCNDAHHAFNLLLLETKFNRIQERGATATKWKNTLAATWFYTKKYTETHTFEANHDAEVCIDRLKKASPVQARVFTQMLSSSLMDDASVMAPELNMTMNNFKVNLSYARKFLQAYLKGVYIRPTRVFISNNSLQYSKDGHYRRTAKFD